MENLFKEDLFDSSIIQLDNSKKEFVCDCGRKFYGKWSFNGHQGKCRVHLGEEKYLQTMQRSVDALRKGTEQYCLNMEQERNKREKDWSSTGHICKKCGKKFLTKSKYASGLYCSVKCANSHEFSQDSIDKKRNSLSIRNFGLTVDEYRKQYESNPKLCTSCGNPIPFDKRKHKTCSEYCAKQRMRTGGVEGNRKLSELLLYDNQNITGGKMNFKWGTYKGIHCDSSWELAYVMYNLDHNIEFERCRDHFTYHDKNGKSHEYFPDFIQDGEYIEIKNYSTETVELKLQAVIDKGHKIKALYEKDIYPYISYAKKTYGKQYYNLYDEDKPSFKDQIGNKNK